MAPPKKKKKIPALFPRHKQWQECYESWLRAAHQRSGSTDSEAVYRHFCTKFFTDPSRSPDRYTRAEVETFIMSEVRHRGGVTGPPRPHTQNLRLATLRSFYGYALEYDVPYRNGVRCIMTKPNPTRGIDVRQVGHSNRALTEDELERLFAVIPHDTVLGLRDRALLLCYFWCARRRIEIIRLKWGDIFEVVFVEKGKPRVGHMYRFSTKGHSRQTFTAELPQPAWAAIVEYLQAAGRWETMTPESPVFVGIYERHDKPLNKFEPDRIIKKYAALAGLMGVGKQICPHSLRHTRARLSKKRGADIMEISQLLGHSNINTTMIYLYNDDEKPDGTASLLADLDHL